MYKGQTYVGRIFIMKLRASKSFPALLHECIYEVKRICSS